MTEPKIKTKIILQDEDGNTLFEKAFPDYLPLATFNSDNELLQRYPGHH